jgi:hypothetical protein
MLTGRKLALSLSFTVLVAVATGVSCKGFFVHPTLTAIGITPATPTITDIAPNNTQQFSAVGTFDDGSYGSTPVTWSSTDSSGTGTVANIDASSGLATAVGLGQASITATSTIIPTITGTTTLTVVPGDVTSIKASPPSQSTGTNDTFYVVAKDQAGNDISGSVTWTFYVHATTTVETGMTPGTADANGQPFVVGTLSPTPAPVNLDVIATLTVNGSTVTSNTITVDVTQ